MASLEIEDVTKSYGATLILDRVSVAVPDGAFLTLVGPSGCGKSTVLRILAGLELQDGGRLRIGGQEVSHLRPSRRDIAMVFQSYALYPHMTVAQNIAIPLILRRLPLWQRLPLLSRLLPQINAQFGLTPEQLDQLDPKKREQVQKAVGLVGSVLIGKLITRELVLRATQTVGLRLSTKQVAKYVPLAGQAVAATIGYATLRYLGEQHLRDCIRVVQQAQLRLPAPASASAIKH